MRVHPAPRKRNITFRYDANPCLSATDAGAGGRQKKLRRLPHIFSKVLELPLDSDADVSIEEGPDGFRFVAATVNLRDDVRARAIEIYPGVMKLVIRDGDGEVEEDELDLDRWRFRLPPSSLPALATAAYADGELVVTIPTAEEGIGEAKDEGIIYASISTSV
ncbi:17.4 kDa class I heat shock protein-like [Cocos nucifera]|nr:17.4 kDa class I heat shock protein-like [Cocos nucifera]